MVSASQSVRGRACEWQVLLGAPPAAVVSGAFFCVVLCTRNCPGRCCPARRVRPIVYLFGFTRRPRKRVPAVAGRAAPSTKKLDLHGRPGLNASTVCVFSFEQSAYSKEIAQERKDTQKAQLTWEPATRSAWTGGRRAYAGNIRVNNQGDSRGR